MIASVAEDPEQVDVDARFLLANERTLLAWIRTALAFMAIGAGLHQFGTSTAGRQVLSAVLIAIGGGAAVLGAHRYRQADHAIRHGLLPARPTLPAILAVAVVAVGVALIVAVALDARA